MLKVHHLNNSRSQRILWLLEELEVPYEIRRYQRDAKTMFAPPDPASDAKWVGAAGAASYVISKCGEQWPERFSVLGFAQDKKGRVS